MKRKNVTALSAIALLVVTCVVFAFAVNGYGNETNAQTGNSENALTLVENGTSDYVIIVGADTVGKSAETAEGAEYYSALDLQKYIKNMTGVTLPLVKDTDTEITENEKAIIVGLTNREGVSYTIDRASLGEEGYTIKTVGNTVVIAGGRPRGTGYAVYDFLENYFGCKFYTNKIKTWPEYDVLTLDPISDDTFVPVFWVRFLNGRLNLESTTEGDAATAAKVNGNYVIGAIYGGRMTHAYRSGDWRFVHTLNHLLDIDPHYYYSETFECPECGEVYNGEDKIPGTNTRWEKASDSVVCPKCNNAIYKDFINHLYNASDEDIANYISMSSEPSGRVRFQACIAGLNPISGGKVSEEAVEGVFRWLRESAAAGHVNDRLISVSQYDASFQYGGCECADCKAMENLTGAASGNWIWICNQAARAIKNDYPHISVNTISYLYTNEAPTNIKAEDNVSVFLCTNDYCAAHPFNECGVSLRYPSISDMTKRVTEWKAVSDHLLFYDYYRSNGDPRWIYPIQYQIFYNYKWYYDLGFEGGYSYMLEEEDNFCKLNQYLASKMMWHPDMSFEEFQELIDNFCAAAYGPGWKSMTEVIKAYNERSTSSENCWGMCTRDAFTIMPSSLVFNDETYDFTVDSSFVEKVQALFDDALSKAETTQQKDNIEAELVNFYYYKLRDLHYIKENYSFIVDYDVPLATIDSQIYETADKLIELLVKFDLDSIGYEYKAETDHEIDLSDAANFDRMQPPENW